MEDSNNQATNPKLEENKKQLQYCETLLAILMKCLFTTPNLLPSTIKWFMKCLHRNITLHFWEEDQEIGKSLASKIVCGMLFTKWLITPLFLAPSCYFNVNSSIFKNYDKNKGKYNYTK